MDYFTWEQDVNRLRDAWVEAKPMAGHLERFGEWMDGGDEDEKILMMVKALLGVDDDKPDED